MVDTSTFPADGAYADAKLMPDGRGAIAVVLIERGQLAARHGRCVTASDINAAEIEAVLWAMEIYPGVAAFTDNVTAAGATGATWIPRKRNKIAHQAAESTYVMNVDGDGNPRVTMKPRLRRKPRRCQFGGRGVVPKSGYIFCLD